MDTATEVKQVLPSCQRVTWRNWRLPVFGALALATLISFGYWPSLNGGFVWDDLVLVKKNPLATGELNLRSVWMAGDFSLTTVATWLESSAFGENSRGYRMINLALHFGSAVLIWGFLARLRIRGGWWAAALFAVHPVAVASVAWISELKNTLSMPLFLASAWTYWMFLESAKAEATQQQRVYYGLSLLTFLLALLAKTSTVMLPVVLLSLVWWREKRLSRRDLLRTSPHFVLALVFGLMTIWFQSQQAIRGITVQSEEFWARLGAAGQALWFYLGKALLPLNLSMIYPRWNASGLMPAVLPLLLWLAGLVALWRYRAQWGRHALVALGCFTALLLPVLGLVDMYFMIFSRVSDHFAYLALVPIMTLVAAGICCVPDRRLRGLCSAMLLGVFTFLTHERAEVFVSDEALWRDTIAKNPKAWSAYNNLACNLAERGEIALAIPHFKSSLELNPTNAEAHRNLGKALTLQKRFAEAEPHFQSALKLKPQDIEALSAYATGLAENRRYAEAIEHLRKAIRLKPEIQFRLQLAPLLAATGNYAEAATEMQNIITAEPDSYEALNNLAWLRATSPDSSVRNGAEAVQLAQKACELSGNKEAMTFATLGAALAEARDFTNAVLAAQKAIDLSKSAGNESFAAVNQQLQRLYQSGRPFHTPPTK